MPSYIINLENYTVAEHLLFAVGCLLWMVCYVIIIKNIRGRHFIEIPVVAVCANFCWEFLWSFVFITDMGTLYLWGYRVWFLLDCYILYGLFKYGREQIPSEMHAIRSRFKSTVVGLILSWAVMLYYYVDLYDFPISKMGAFSGYILNVMMSGLYITLLSRQTSLHGFSYPAGWYKGVGSLLITGFCFLHFKDRFLLCMCVLTGVLDALYIGLFRQKRKRMLASPVA